MKEGRVIIFNGPPLASQKKFRGHCEGKKHRTVKKPSSEHSSRSIGSVNWWPAGRWAGGRIDGKTK